jgi:hypothetical protein
MESIGYASGMEHISSPLEVENIFGGKLCSQFCGGGSPAGNQGTARARVRQDPFASALTSTASGPDMQTPGFSDPLLNELHPGRSRITPGTPRGSQSSFGGGLGSQR